MLLENARLETYEKWPNDKTWYCTPEKLAKSGFFFNPSSDSPDNVCCAFCRKELDCWDPDDEPLAEHKKHSPKCLFLTLSCPVENLTAVEFLKLVKDVTVFRASYFFDKAISTFESQAADTRQEIIKHISK
ncbi:baculoviral IAP repeat-containing protein 5 [Biomphalaria glabrata]|nr:baculoviral IAP repeat-containing protein 5-like [Biomphalaria glabrata]KAI8797454.1 baculoviral IAP repeat-containing protein 5 [Biomphalaria glabrata]